MHRFFSLSPPATTTTTTQVPLDPKSADALRAILLHADGFVRFEDFISKEFSVENLHFWSDVLNYKRFCRGRLFDVGFFSSPPPLLLLTESTCEKKKRLFFFVSVCVDYDRGNGHHRAVGLGAGTIMFFSPSQYRLFLRLFQTIFKTREYDGGMLLWCLATGDLERLPGVRRPESAVEAAVGHLRRAETAPGRQRRRRQQQQQPQPAAALGLEPGTGNRTSTQQLVSGTRGGGWWGEGERGRGEAVENEMVKRNKGAN